DELIDIGVKFIKTEDVIESHEDLALGVAQEIDAEAGVFAVHQGRTGHKIAHSINAVLVKDLVHWGIVFLALAEFLAVGGHNPAATDDVLESRLIKQGRP